MNAPNTEPTITVGGFSIDILVQGFPGKGSTPAELGSFTRVQLKSWADAVKAAGIQPD